MPETGKQFVDKLIELTRSGKARWKRNQSPAHFRSFSCEVRYKRKKFRVKVSSYHVGDYDPPADDMGRQSVYKYSISISRNDESASTEYCAEELLKMAQTQAYENECRTQQRKESKELNEQIKNSKEARRKEEQKLNNLLS